jgi:hypothetical protein
MENLTPSLNLENMLTHLEVVQVEGEPLTILTVFCTKEQTIDIINKASKIGIPHERTNNGVKLFN